MGLAKSKNILVIGLSNSGKSHLIDYITNVGYLSRQPSWIEKTRCGNYHFTEIGGSVNLNMIHEVPDCIYMVIRDQIHESNSLLLMASVIFENTPIAVIWNGIKPPESFFYPKNRRICSCTLDFDDFNWMEKFQKLLEWVDSGPAGAGIHPQRDIP